MERRSFVLGGAAIGATALAGCAGTPPGNPSAGAAPAGPAPAAGPAAPSANLLTGRAAFADWRSDAPGVRRLIRASDLPPPPPVTAAEAEKSVASTVKVVPAPAGALPRVPEGFAVQVLATGFKQPRTMRIAPNGDLFLAESGAGRVLLFPAGPGGVPAAQPQVFAESLERPYGIAFVPPADPQYVYVAAANQVVRYPYRSGDARASGPAEVVIDNIPTKRHWTRDLAVTRDGRRLFLAVGSASNLGVADMPDLSPQDIRRHEQVHGRGAAWGGEMNRAVVRVFDPEGEGIRNYATGLRNCSGLAMQPGTDNLWGVVNERDHLGPQLAPDFMARVQDGGYYGWPWYYVGGTEDPALRGKRPDLRGQMRQPEVLIQPHSSALSVAFYDRDAFPADYRGDAFVALHGSHSAPQRTGYKVIRVRMQGGQPTGEYEDFMTGFLLDNDRTWGRPAGVAVTPGGALLVSDDANGTIFRVARR
ncbi:PQQ-dependent sugar dehydrogenase [Ramlibacter tataouinensis]|uniref:PQQ-dependent sugar dehydrogenase n=1 Tax=Ramlibacter tataouinensis TaxID=94132 RepID=UPI0022F3F00D|nr:PQQ-dependent sugar dehydrogenase [Ramlibacter tataouinensis]WBY01174.1 PQQ-dependent sugar dehydrogenase [Ramlibacter tataouinensis]